MRSRRRARTEKTVSYVNHPRFVRFRRAARPMRTDHSYFGLPAKISLSRGRNRVDFAPIDSLARSQVDSAADAPDMRPKALDLMNMNRIAGRKLALCTLGAALSAAAPARADLRMCNNTNNRVSVALGYTDGQNWVSEGWWNLKSLDCATLLRGALAAEYYYLYAMDERGGEWKGKVFMCTSDREFKIDGRQDCFVRGYNRTGFFEVDTGKDSKSWTVQLTDQANP
jgi:uncharacterized membrane protein